ncbi:uncharacterized protein LTR77_001561 [Saxophila tyrrhenica]|uniref:Haloacid dehalogenase-like hydrolase n=1 Tax=Saxophila tyrrhenica TaxID=1690608 RepID=A0AAV9PL41_9PEZI|nr:hypothetical protein LTR77_001561 [Saxophila tyrrhenica]
MATRRPRINLILDFDGTMTREDTTSIIGSRVLAKARELAQPGVAEDKLPKPMQFYSERYMDDYRRWKDSHPCPVKERWSVEDEVAYLSQSKLVEQESFLRVREAVLRTPGRVAELERDDAVRDEFMMEAGRDSVRGGEVQIREAEILEKMIALAEQDGNEWSVVSVSWSRRFILGALLEAGVLHPGRMDEVVKRVYCNELLAPLPLDKNGEPEITCTAKDKQDVLSGLLANWKHDSDNIPIYVGDSTTDIGCLLGPAIGMYLTSGKAEDAVLQTFAQLNVESTRIEDLPTEDAPRKLLEMRGKLEAQGKPGHIVCTITSLEQLYTWLTSLQ